MVTDLSPKDYQKRILIVSKPVRICLDCGGRIVAMPPFGKCGCIECRQPGDGIEVWEHELPEWRAEIALAHAIAADVLGGQS